MWICTYPSDSRPSGAPELSPRRDGRDHTWWSAARSCLPEARGRERAVQRHTVGRDAEFPENSTPVLFSVTRNLVCFFFFFGPCSVTSQLTSETSAVDLFSCWTSGQAHTVHLGFLRWAENGLLTAPPPPTTFLLCWEAVCFIYILFFKEKFSRSAKPCNSQAFLEMLSLRRFIKTSRVSVVLSWEPEDLRLSLSAVELYERYVLLLRMFMRKKQLKYLLFQ